MKKFHIISLAAVLQHFFLNSTWIQLGVSQTDSPNSNISWLLPFGANVGDLQGPQADDGASNPMILRVPFTFFGTEYREIIVNSNGLLSFGKEFIQYNPRQFPITSPPLIAPFWRDFDPSVGGNITYRQSNDSVQLEGVHRLLSGLDSGNNNLTAFYPEHIFMATWHQVPPYGQFPPRERNTLQVLLATDRIQTIAMFIYDDIEWGERAQIGFNAGDGHAFFILPGALSDETIDMDENTNVGEPGVFVYRIDNLGLVECSTTTDCRGPIILEMMTIRKCCVSSREGLAYTSPGSNECHVCIVYGWFKDSFAGVEQDLSYSIEAGYQKGAQHAGLNLLLLTTARPALSDFMIDTGEIRVSYENPDPEIVAVHFYADNVSQEGNETFTMELVPSHSTMELSGESVFFLNTIDMTIIDSDVLEISLSQNAFRASESAGEIDISVCKDKPVSTSVTVMITTATVDNTNLTGRIVIHDINSLSTADQNDFSATEHALTFFFGSVNCLSHNIDITDDDINEAIEQVFIIQLTLVRSVEPNKINISQGISQGIIIDDDPITIGFEEPSYTFIEPPFLESFYVLLVKEGNQMSEQIFQLLIQVSNLTNPFKPASLGEDYRTITTLPIIFPSDQQYISWEFELLSNEDLEDNEAFRVTISSVGDSNFFTNGSSLYNETLIVINDAQNPVGFSQNVYTVHEDENFINITIFSYISVTSIDEIMVNFTTFSKSAIDGEDYLELALQIPITGNQSTAEISIPIINDSIAEGLETIGGMLEVVSHSQNLSFVSMIHIEIIDNEVKGICGHRLENGFCDDNALCRVSTNGRTLVDCYCREGFIGNGYVCQDINECLTGEHDCHKNAECLNTLGSFDCSCEFGFFGDGNLCISITSQVPGPCDELRENCACFNGSSICGCLPGYDIARNEEGSLVCQDINECENGRRLCNGTCENIPGSYSCFCPTGYVPNPTGEVCIDIDECQLRIHDCSRDAVCSNTVGGYNCTCKDNFFGNGRSCLNVDECATRCEHRCIATMDYSVCGCHSGYYLMPNQQDCADINECVVYSNCDKNARCINNIGSYYCECRDGFQGNGFICRDIDECDTGLHDCHMNATCNNTSGSYTCTCNNKLFGNGTHCNAGVGPLISITAPTNLWIHSSHFRGDFNSDYHTIGADFCFEDTNTLPHNGVLIWCPVANNPFPPPQFNVTTARILLDSSVNLLFSHPMENIRLNNSMLLLLFEEETEFLNVTCKVFNHFGSDAATTIIRTCGPTECQQHGTHNCTQLCSRNVTNGTTAYECSCNEGYIPNENLCNDIDECLNASANTCSLLNNEVCRNTEGSYTCNCSLGYQKYQENEPCADKDECLTETDTCSENENCVNTPGSFTCLCNAGFIRSYNESNCEDIDECANETLNNCFAGNHQVCRNVLGSFDCDCEPGYEAGSVDNTCQDINECLSEDIHGCPQLCNNTEGSYECFCDTGFILDPSDNSTCHDVNECLEVHGCHSNAMCTNTLGSYHCQCKTGHDGDGMNCQLSTVVSFSSGLGAVVFLLITVVVIVVAYYGCRHFAVKKNLHRTDTSVYQNESSQYGQPLTRTKKFSVQSSFRLELPPPLIIEASTVKLDETIGQGEFGIVYKGQLEKAIGHVSHSEVVAIKTLKGFYDSNAVKEMLRECSKMYKFKHPNVLALHGVCLDGGTAPYIIMPFMANGSLLAYLKGNRKTLVISGEDKDDDEVGVARKRLTDMCIQVAKGMEYLARKKVVHRDLAARNCMIDVNFVIKVADFGLSESVGTKDYFRQNKDAMIKLPLKWLAPESMEDHIFSEKSDVWAYGVTCWEIFNGGRVPYPSINLIDLPRELASGHRLEQPNNYACNSEMYMFMLQCWEFEPEMRPTFSSIVVSLSQFLEVMVDYMDINTFSNWSTEPTASTVTNDDSRAVSATMFENDNFIEIEMKEQ